MTFSSVLKYDVTLPDRQVLTTGPPVTIYGKLTCLCLKELFRRSDNDALMSCSNAQKHFVAEEILKKFELKVYHFQFQNVNVKISNMLIWWEILFLMCKRQIKILQNFHVDKTY